MIGGDRGRRVVWGTAAGLALVIVGALIFVVTSAERDASVVVLPERPDEAVYAAIEQAIIQRIRPRGPEDPMSCGLHVLAYGGGARPGDYFGLATCLEFDSSCADVSGVGSLPFAATVRPGGTDLEIPGDGSLQADDLRRMFRSKTERDAVRATPELRTELTRLAKERACGVPGMTSKPVPSSG